MIFAFFLAVSSALAADDLDPRVAFVVSIGEWNNGGQRGTFRFVTKTHGFEHASTSLWMQWVAYPEGSDGESAAVRSVAINELNDGFFSFESPACLAGWPCKKFSLIATHIYSHESHAFEIKADGLGEYQIREVSP
ncbi:hypothetical protein [Alkalilimnicola ehrlichii]|uniref:hypothetical protein n=1 Tax=Alkalilimnicola ehrlichii TaxID=351052 RepID=UPI0011C048A7|nr:hypothetical protein [Alkalilimnicola ehrlichii]